MMKTDTPCPMCQDTSSQRLIEKKGYGTTWYMARCASCDLHYTDPVPTLEQVKKFYQGNYHVNLREEQGTEKQFQAKYHRYISMIKQHVPAGGRTLDVGCSTGLFPKMLKDEGFQAEGAEINPDTARWGQEHFGIPITNGVLDDVLKLDRQFDLVSMTDVLEHTINPGLEMPKVRQLLKSRGYFLVTFPDIHSPSSRYLKMMYRLTGKNWMWSTCHIPLHIWEFSYATAMKLFTDHGFKLVAFQRSQEVEFDLSLPGLLSAPANITALPGISRFFGNQMEFLLQRKD